MSNYAISLKRTSLLLAAMSFTALLLVVNFAAFFGKADAAQLTNRSLTLSSTLSGTEGSTTPAGSATNGAAAEHTFTFTNIGTTADQAVFEYCTTALGSCTMPANLDVDSVAVGSGGGSASGSGGVITWTPATNLTGTTTVTFTTIRNPDYDTNPSNPDSNTFFVRITTRVTAGSTDVDEGTVASAITEGIQITARVAETLGFSTTGDFTQVGDPTGACVALEGSGAITLGNPAQENTLELTTAYDNYSAFRIYTNAANGVDVQYHGSTLTHSNGTDTINPIAGPAVSAPGSEQFGLAIDTTNGGDGAGSTPITPNSRSAALEFQYVDSTANLSTNGALTPTVAYDGGAGTINGTFTAEFAFAADTPTTIAESTSYVECKTAAVRYLANISPTTTSGTYTTTIVYSAVPTY